MKTIKELNEKWWYRLLKVLYTFCYIIALIFCVILSWEEKIWGNWIDVLKIFIIGIFIAFLGFEIIKRVFYYIIINKPFVETNEVSKLKNKIGKFLNFFTENKKIDLENAVYTNVNHRIFAFIVDFIIIMGVTILIEGIAGHIIVGLPIILYFLHYAFFISSSKKATPGLILVKSKIVNYQGRKLNFISTIIRSLLAIISFVFPILFLFIVHSGKKQALHDKIVRCYIIKT